ncbi:MAG: FtsX-like permease family protein, partial [Chloroflexi bacterium]|nr:FtsX-like permease family protein [Chloroflexota bacterium]
VRNQLTTAVSGRSTTSGSRIGLILLGLIIIGTTIFALVGQPNIFVALGAFALVLTLTIISIVLLLPGLMIGLGTAVRPFLVRWWGTNGRLAADNLRRNPRRTAHTATALMAGILMIIATTGFLQIFLKGGFSAPVSQIQGDAFVGFDLLNVVDDEFDYENLNFDFFFDAIDPNLVIELDALAAAGSVKLMPMRGVEVPPELQLTPGSPALLVDPQAYFDSGNFTLFEGDQTQALALMAQGNAILLQPYLAEHVNASVGNSITLPTPHGDVDFIVAGIGGSSFPMAILPFSAGERYFDAAEPSFIGILIPDNQNREQAITDVTAIVEQYPEYTTYHIDDMIDPVMVAMGQLQQTLTALLFMAVIVAALGVVNTMVINVAERRREIGLFRAVGATQRQVRQTVIAEAATLGFIAALIAALFSFLLIGLLALLFIPNGYASVGQLVDLVLWQEAYGPALRDMGVATAVSLILAPIIAGLAAYYPARQAAAVNVIEATRSERLIIGKTQYLKETRSLSARKHRRNLRSLSISLAFRNLNQNRLRTALSALSVALGTSAIIAADVTGSAIRNAGQALEGTEATIPFIGDFLNSTLSMMGLVILIAAGFLIFN